MRAGGAWKRRLNERAGERVRDEKTEPQPPARERSSKTELSTRMSWVKSGWSGKREL